MSERLSVLALNIGEPLAAVAANLAAMSDEVPLDDGAALAEADAALAELDGTLATLAAQAQGVRSAIAARG